MNPYVPGPSLSTHAPLATFHSLAVPSHDALSIKAPSGENAALFTHMLWPCMVRRHSPELALQSLTQGSSEVVSTIAPSGEKAAHWSPSP